MQHKERIQSFVEEIWRWYARHKRTLPWRDVQIADDTQRAYLILVSEVMLQQTQVPRVVVIFKQFIERFPTIEHLARASNSEVLIAWRGMGYNSRALRLRDAARHIVTRCGVVENERVILSSSKNDTRTTCMVRRAHHDTLFPQSMEELLSIPGIGPYTAAAIRNFAFGIPTPCVDVNVERILTRVFGVKTKKVGEKAGEVLRMASWPPSPGPFPRAREKGGQCPVIGECPSPPQGGGERGGGKAAHWHSALMDFGSLVCTKRSPKCAKCPLSQGICKSAFRVSTLRQAQGDTRREPGRFVGCKFVPNRIIRGKIVDLLRDHPQGLTLEIIGREICLDWSRERQPWLRDIVAKLQREKFVEERRGKHYALPERTA